MFNHVLKCVCVFFFSFVLLQASGGVNNSDIKRYHTFQSIGGGLNLQITEFMALNTSFIADEDGDYSDWIEIYNPGDASVNTEGYFLTDNPKKLRKWIFPTYILPPHGYLVVFASEKSRSNAGSPIHTNFKLSDGGEYLALVAPDGNTVIQEFGNQEGTLFFPPQTSNISYGIDQSGAAGYFKIPTPNAVNSTMYDGLVANTEVYPSRGFYDSPVEVNMSCSTSGATIRYTLDGSEPTSTHGEIYNGALTISQTKVLRVAAFRTGFAPNKVLTQSYIFPKDVIASPLMRTSVTQSPVHGPKMLDALTALPSISISTGNGVIDQYVAPAGPYPDWTYNEVGVSMEWLLPDNTDNFQIDAGACRFGGHWYDVAGRTRPFDKWNYRLYFRSDYGASKLKFPLFKGFEYEIPTVEEFDQLELNSGSQDMSARGFYMSSALTQDLMIEMGNVNPHGRFVHVYLNGIYIGQYLLRERWNADMNANYLGGEKESYESIKTHENQGGWSDLGLPYDGDGSAWTNAIALKNNYELVKSKVDMISYIDFMLMFMFGYSEAEYRCVGPTTGDGGFKFWLNDPDGFTRAISNRATGAANIDGPGKIFSALLTEGNPDFKTLLADRIYKHFFNQGAMTTESMTRKLMNRIKQTEVSFLAESARWGYLTPEKWVEKRTSYINDVLSVRPTAALNEFKAAGFYPSIDAPAFSQNGGTVVAGFQLSMNTNVSDIFYTTDGTDPRLSGGAKAPNAIGYHSSSSNLSNVDLIGQNTSVAYKVPVNSDLGTNWMQADYLTTGWNSYSNSGPGVGYDNASTFVPYINHSVMNEMYGKNSSIYIRYEFNIDDPANYSDLQLNMKYDDGYVASLNGTQIASGNAPSVIDWNSSALSNRSDATAVIPEVAVLKPTNPSSLLKKGKNVLAIQGLNYNSTSTDMLIVPNLKAAFDLNSVTREHVTISNPVTLRARAFDGNQWSALAEADFMIGDPTNVDVVIPGAGENLVLSQNYPNPFKDKTYMDFQVNVGSSATLQVFDMLGRCVYRKNFQIQEGVKQTECIEPENWKDGMYIYKLETNLGESRIGKMLYVK